MTEKINLSDFRLENMRLWLGSVVKHKESLIDLDLSNNNLAAFPEEILTLSNLRSLTLDKNQIKHFPIDFSSIFSNLKLLSISNNQLEGLPINLSKLEKLQYLNVACNQISKLTDQLCRLKRLDSLYLHHNWFTSIPTSFSELMSNSSL